MKKKCLLLLLIPVLVMCLTACTSINGTSKDGKTITLEDSKYGKTTFTYDKKLNYSDFKEGKGGASKEITFKNTDLNIKVQMYYNKMKAASYDETKKSRMTQTYYKDMVFNNNPGYFYSNDRNSGNINVVLYTDSKTSDTTVLFVAVEKIDNKKDTDMFSMLDSEDIYNLFNSMVFENSSK